MTLIDSVLTWSIIDSKTTLSIERQTGSSETKLYKDAWSFVRVPVEDAVQNQLWMLLRGDIRTNKLKDNDNT